MPGKRSNSTSGEAHAGAFLGDDGVAAQRRLEAAAQGIALDHRDAVHASSYSCEKL
jgi:hypothetical protein